MKEGIEKVWIPYCSKYAGDCVTSAIRQYDISVTLPSCFNANHAEL